MIRKQVAFAVLLVALTHVNCNTRVNLSCGQIRAFVDGHNFRRWVVAQGAALRQPAASDMLSMKTEDYNLPLCVAYVDYEKAFDSIETWAVLNSLQRCRIDYRYIEVLKYLYTSATIPIRVIQMVKSSWQRMRQSLVIDPIKQLRLPAGFECVFASDNMAIRFSHLFPRQGIREAFGVFHLYVGQWLLMHCQVWDEELSEKAARWAENGNFSHNPDRTIGSQRWPLVGENLFYSKFWSTLDIPIIPNIEEALNSWFNEHLDYGFYPFKLGTKKVIGHYTQMVWANSNRLGCGISQKKENGETFTLFVCNYGPTGNYIGQLPYNASSYPGYLLCPDGQCAKPYGCACSF